MKNLKALTPIHIPGLAPGMARADSTPSVADVIAAVGKVQGAFEAFKEQNDKRIQQIEAKGSADVVTKETTDKINAKIGEFDNELRELNAKLAAARTSNDDKPGASAEAKAHRKAFNAMVRGARDADERALGDLAVKAALSTDSNPDGGYVVPEELDRNISRVVGKTLGMRSVARSIAVGGAVYKAIHNVAGANSGWVGEKGARPQTNTPQLVALEFPTMEQYAMPMATQAVLDDAFFDVEAWLAEEVAIQFREQEGDAFINGDGTNKPRGFLQYPFAASTPSSPSAWGVIGRTKTGVNGDFAAAPNGGDALIDLQMSLKPAYRANAQWLMNDASLAKARKLKDSQGAYLWQPAFQADQPSLLLGHAVMPDDNMPDFNTNTYPIAFGDWNRGYLITDRMGARLLRDPYSAKPYVAFYVTRRVGGGVRDFHAIKVLQAAA